MKVPFVISQADPSAMWLTITYTYLKNIYIYLEQKGDFQSSLRKLIFSLHCKGKGAAASTTIGFYAMGRKLLYV